AQEARGGCCGGEAAGAIELTATRLTPVLSSSAISGAGVVLSGLSSVAATPEAGARQVVLDLLERGRGFGCGEQCNEVRQGTASDSVHEFLDGRGRSPAVISNAAVPRATCEAGRESARGTSWPRGRRTRRRLVASESRAGTASRTGGRAPEGGPRSSCRSPRPPSRGGNGGSGASPDRGRATR